MTDRDALIADIRDNQVDDPPGTPVYVLMAPLVEQIIAALSTPPPAPTESDDYQRGKRDAVRALANATKKRLTDDSVASLVAALTAADAPPATPVTDESSWLIERDIDSVLHYWTGRVIDGREIGAWSANHLDARRFARREDAACMLTWHCGGNGRVAEHMWTPLHANPSSASTPPPADLVALVREWRKSRIALRDAEDPQAYDKAEQVYVVFERALLAYPLTAPDRSDRNDTRRDCTCLGSCRGPEGLGERWKCALGKSPAPDRSDR